MGMSGYSGPASVASGSFTLSNALSQQIFAGPEAQLTLIYSGPDITVGLPGYSLKHDLTITLAGGPLSVGALDYGVTLAEAASSAVTAPEPASGALLIASGILLCLISAGLKLLRRARVTHLCAADRSCDVSERFHVVLPSRHT